MGSVVLDVRYALRSLVRRPGYALLTIGVLALAIACNTTVFSALNAFLLRPLPYLNDDRIVMVFNSFPKMGFATGGSSIPDYLDRRAQAPSLADLAIVTPASRALTGGATAEQLSAVRASPSLFNVLGVTPALGRVFTEQEATIGNERVVILSDALWRTSFGARADLVGSDVELDGQPHRVVGVMPAGFGFPDRSVDAWLPFAFTPQQTSDQERGNDFSTTVGRLKADATLDALNAELDAIAQRQIGLYPGGAAFVEATGFTGRAQPLREYIVGDAERTLYLLQGLVLTVLLIACANVASLQLARVIARRKEIAVRSSLG
ncbi:MAG TPA: ABC transporter permease, partial [Gammaproteobacteria bacterium]|nr:ABC transporter permease [Gammaproteobacteria bacterium]